MLGPIVWPFIVAGLLTAFPQITQTPASASWFAYLISAVLPMWSAITDGGWCFLLGGILLYALYNHKTLRLLAWAGMSFLGEFLLTYLQVRRLPDFTSAQMFTVYYEWLGIFAVVLMLLYNGKRGRGCKPLFYIFYPAHVYILYALSCLTYMRML